MGTLTVKETLWYSARLRLPSTMSRKDLEDRVNEIIKEMGLEKAQDTAIGNW